MRNVILALTVCFMSTVCEAKEIAGVVFPDTLKNDGLDLSLNGAGIRTKFFMDLYIGGLYLKQKESNPQNIITADEPMAIQLHIISSLITSEKMEAATREGFVNATAGNTAPLEDNIESFMAVFKEKIQKHDMYALVYVPKQGMKVYKNSKLKAEIPGMAFKQALFGIWLCEKPAQASLKKEMLGQ
ncbi:MAG: chalcone isomerase family protein [Pseudomonadota bacterium]